MSTSIIVLFAIWIFRWLLLKWHHGATSSRHWVHYKPPVFHTLGVETYGLRIKYLKGEKRRETLSSCSVFTTKRLLFAEKIKNVSAIRNDCKMMILSAEDFLARNAHYHATCYCSYTSVDYNKDKDETRIQEDEENDN